MAYNYGAYQNYYGGAYGNSNFNPNNMQTQQNMQYQQPNFYSQNYQINNSLDGFPSYFVDTYDQVRQANVASDGTPSIFISNVEDRFWLKKTNTENGRTIVKTFIFKEDTEEQNKTNATIMNNGNNNEETYIKKEDLDLLLAPLIEEMNIIKGAIFNSAPNVGDNNNVNIQKNNEKLSENKLKIPD